MRERKHKSARSSGQKVRVEDITLVAESTYSTRRWLELYGTPRYSVKLIETVEGWCEKGALPAGWKALRRGHRLYIFYAGQKSTAKAPASRIPPQQLEQLRRAAATGQLKPGEQKQYARRWGCSESYVSRLVRGERGARSRTPQLGPDAPPLPTVMLAPTLVENVFNVLFTVKEWIELVARKQYGINSLQYVYQLCAGAPNGPLKRPTSLPEGWRSVRMGDSWHIFHHTLKARNLRN